MEFISVFDLFKIGIGPSSSHTVGPMKAMAIFLSHLTDEKKLIDQTHIIKIILYGSLGSTGKGHGTDKALYLGLEGHLAESVDPEYMKKRFVEIKQTNKLNLAGKKIIDFNPEQDVIFHKNKTLPLHSNALEIFALDENKNELLFKAYYSIGGGFIHDQESLKDLPKKPKEILIPYPFSTADKLLKICSETGLKISEVMMANEKIFRTEDTIIKDLMKIWQAMDQCIENGLKQEGILPGGLKVKRRAKGIHQRILNRKNHIATTDAEKINAQLEPIDWLNLYSISVNEENADGNRIVTAPTNGAAGIIPAVLKFYVTFFEDSQEKIIEFLLTAAAIGILFKINASISGAEVGCQGEVGSACSMAAGGLCALMDGTVPQIENAAEIAMEHNLGLTCDPIGGLVQVPCIERNAMASVKAMNSVKIALKGDGTHFVSLDKVIKTMKDTGMDMSDKYKETARGGLAVNIIEC